MYPSVCYYASAVADELGTYTLMHRGCHNILPWIIKIAAHKPMN